MKILLSIEGGVGKNIAATGAVKIAAENHQVDVITAWPQVWEGNPNVNKIWEWSRVEYTSQFIKQYDQLYFDDPYRNTQFLLGATDLTGTYNLMLNGKSEPVTPQLFLNKAEHLYVTELLKDIKKPIFVVQTNGGTSGGYSWNRDIPLEEVVPVLNNFTEEYEIIHLRAKGQPEITGIKHIEDLNIRQALIVLAMSKKRLLIDSVYQHAAAALNLPSVVLWVQTEVEKFGYQLHTNIQCNEPQLRNMDRLEGLFGGLDADINKCPFAIGQPIFDIGKIIAALK